MSKVIGKGGNAAVRGGMLRVSATPAGIDLTALCLRGDGKVGGDEDFVFYNQPRSPDGAVRLSGAELEIDVAGVAAGTDRIVVSASVDAGTFGDMALAVRIVEDGGDTYDLPITGLTSETTVILAEVYRRAGGWKIRNVAQGYATGLAGLATDFGITVDDPPSPAVIAAPDPSPPAPEPSVGPPVHPATSEAWNADSTPSVNFAKGAVTLTKGAPPVLLRKAPLVRLRVAWESGTDYEAYALVVLTSGEVVHIATFPAAGVPAAPHYGELVRHLGDRGRGDVRRGGGQAEEIIEVRLAPEILAVIPVAYSAINNGTGSFHKYRVTLSIESGADSVTIPADQAKKSAWIFTCVPGIVYNRPEGVLIERLEFYSKRFSERRPEVILRPGGEVEVRMDKGPVNQFKSDRT
ncbi:TerD family protein [Nocardia sp. NPDC003345]